MNRHLCVIYRPGQESFGMGNRVRTVISSLKRMNITFCESTPTQYIFRDKHQTSGVCIVSFVNSWVIPFARIKRHSIWLDSVDSRKLTINWQIKSKNSINFLRALRSTLFIGLINRANLISYICERDRLSDSPKPLSFSFANHVPTFEKSKSKDKRFVLMGDWSYYPNINGLLIFMENVWNPLQSRLQNIPLHIYGGNIPRQIRKSRLVVIEGYREEYEIYTEGSIFLVPLLVGSGVKNKALLPLSLGCQVVTTVEGAIDMRPKKNLRIVEDFQEFRKTLIEYVSHWPSSLEPQKNLTYSKDMLSYKKLIEKTFWSH